MLRHCLWFAVLIAATQIDSAWAFDFTAKTSSSFQTLGQNLTQSCVNYLTGITIGVVGVYAILVALEQMERPSPERLVAFFLGGGLALGANMIAQVYVRLFQ